MIDDYLWCLIKLYGVNLTPISYISHVIPADRKNASILFHRHGQIIVSSEDGFELYDVEDMNQLLVHPFRDLRSFAQEFINKRNSNEIQVVSV